MLQFINGQSLCYTSSLFRKQKQKKNNNNIVKYCIEDKISHTLGIFNG